MDPTVTKFVTVQSAPFVKPHCVLIVAVATVLLIYRRSAHRSERSKNYASSDFLSRYSPMAELLPKFWDFWEKELTDRTPSVILVKLSKGRKSE